MKTAAPKCKYIVVTGGVLSGLGKGIAAASIGNLLSGRLKVVPIKCDGYLNTDPGTMNPIEHGEVFVQDDGGEVDMDFGHYERFMNIDTSIHRPVIEWPAEGGLYRDAGRHSVTDVPIYRLQLGAYGYSRSYLEQYAALPPSVDEIELSHEILRAPGLAPLRAHPARPGASVDVPADLVAAEHALRGAKRPDPETATNTERSHRPQGIPA